MSWGNAWPTTTNDPRDALGRDELLLQWNELKLKLEQVKQQEIEFRRYIVKRAFPDTHEGTNTQELGNGYNLKAVVKKTYNLADNKIVEETLNEIENLGNDGKFIAERLVSWTPNFLLTEYRQIEKDAAEGSENAKKLLGIIAKMLTIKEAAPELKIVEPKRKS